MKIASAYNVGGRGICESKSRASVGVNVDKSRRNVLARKIKLFFAQNGVLGYFSNDFVVQVYKSVKNAVL
jgi:hypothetical protein